MIDKEILDSCLNDKFKKIYKTWESILDSNISFTLDNSKYHNKNHCRRVMLYSLILAETLSLNDSYAEKLAVASVFHDARRINELFDEGHGDRGAEYYKSYCTNNGIKFDVSTYYLISLHDRSDVFGLEKIDEVIDKDDIEEFIILYNIFKDSDGLDRMRLGLTHFDNKYLRLKESHFIIDFARKLIEMF